MRTAKALERRIVRHDVRVCVIGQGMSAYRWPLERRSPACAPMVSTPMFERVVACTPDAMLSRVSTMARTPMAMDTGRLSFGTDIAAAADADIVLICVPTPLVDHRPDLSAVESATQALSRRSPAGSLVILESTTYPGTTEQVVRPLLEVRRPSLWA